MAKTYYNIEKDGKVILWNIRSANTFLSRFMGLMTKKDLGGDGGIYLTPCGQVHTFMMRFCIDIVFLSHDHEVLHIESSLRPCRVTPYVRGSAGVLEAASGFARDAGLKTGDKLDFVKRG